MNLRLMMQLLKIRGGNILFKNLTDCGDCGQTEEIFHLQNRLGIRWPKLRFLPIVYFAKVVCKKIAKEYPY